MASANCSLFISTYVYLCRYDAVSDQCQLQGVEGVPLTPWELRQEVCTALRYLPNRFKWIELFFNGNFDSYSRFIAKHSQPKRWTDSTGIMVAATALFLGKN